MPSANPPSPPQIALNETLPAADQAPAAQITVPAISVKGDLRLEEVRAFLEQHANDLLACLSKPGESVEVKWTVEADGSVKNIQITSSGGTQTLKNCLSQQMEKWSFLVPKDGRKAQVTATFLRLG